MVKHCHPPESTTAYTQRCSRTGQTQQQNSIANLHLLQDATLGWQLIRRYVDQQFSGHSLVSVTTRRPALFVLSSSRHSRSRICQSSKFTRPLASKRRLPHSCLKFIAHLIRASYAQRIIPLAKSTKPKHRHDTIRESPTGLRLNIPPLVAPKIGRSPLHLSERPSSPSVLATQFRPKSEHCGPTRHGHW